MDSEDAVSEGWVLLPDEEDDPRFDAYGFRAPQIRSSQEGVLQQSPTLRPAAIEAAAPSRPAAAAAAVASLRWRRRISRRRPMELKRLVRQGIPSACRADVWPFLARAETLRCVEPSDYFTSLRNASCAPASAAAADAYHKVARQIDLDVARTFPSHRLFGARDGRQRLRDVLLCYARRSPVEVGYVQGMGFLAAVLLLFLTEEDAFFVLCAIVERLLPPLFFSPSLLGLRAELGVFGELVAAKLPRLSAHLAANGVAPELYATKWFIALYSSTLPIATVLRIWDAFFCEGVKVLHRVGLALLKICEARLLACTEQHHLLLVIQHEEAGCHDVGRLFALAFDTRAFVGPFPRSRLLSLRARRVRALYADPREAAFEAGGGTRAEAVPLTLAPPGAHEQRQLSDAEASGVAESSSDDDDAAGAADPFEMLSVDDLVEHPARRYM